MGSFSTNSWTLPSTNLFRKPTLLSARSYNQTMDSLLDLLYINSIALMIHEYIISFTELQTKRRLPLFSQSLHYRQNTSSTQTVHSKECSIVRPS